MIPSRLVFWDRENDVVFLQGLCGSGLFLSERRRGALQAVDLASPTPCLSPLIPDLLFQRTRSRLMYSIFAGEAWENRSGLTRAQITPMSPWIYSFRFQLSLCGIKRIKSVKEEVNIVLMRHCSGLQ